MGTRLLFLPVPLLLGVALFAGCGPGDGSAPTTSSDTTPLDGRGGGVIAYAREPEGGSRVHEIWAVNADGTGDQMLIAASTGLNHHDWSPDGRHMAAVGYVSDTTWSIYVFEVGVGHLTRLTRREGVWDGEPTWSPDGAVIAFTRIYPSEDHRSEIWVMNADGSQQRGIGIDGFAARWSPDGRRFVYASSMRGPSDLLTCAVDGTDVQPLISTPSTETMPSWSPDGSRVLFVSDRDGNREVYVMDADGTDARRLTNNAVPEFVPRWSPDGTRIVFDSGLSGGSRWEVHVIDADGSNLRRITNTPGSMSAVNPIWRPVPTPRGLKP